MMKMTTRRSKKTFSLNMFKSEKRSMNLFIYRGGKIITSQKWLSENLFCVLGKVLRNPLILKILS